MPSGDERAGDFPHVLGDAPASVRCPTEANLKGSQTSFVPVNHFAARERRGCAGAKRARAPRGAMHLTPSAIAFSFVRVTRTSGAPAWVCAKLATRPRKESEE